MVELHLFCSTSSAEIMHWNETLCVPMPIFTVYHSSCPHHVANTTSLSHNIHWQLHHFQQQHCCLMDAWMMPFVTQASQSSDNEEDQCHATIQHSNGPTSNSAEVSCCNPPASKTPTRPRASKIRTLWFQSCASQQDDSFQAIQEED